MHIPDQSDLPGEQSDRTAMAAAEALEPANLLALWDSISDVIVEIDESSRIRAINAACGPMFGYSRRELLGEPLHVLMPDALRDAHAQGFQRYVATGTKRIPWAGIQITARHKSGREFPIEVSFGERVVGGARVFSGVIRDVSARHAAETARLERDGVLLTVFHASPVAMAITRHADRSFVDVNAQFVRLTGWPADEVLGEAVTSLNLLDVARMSQLRGKRQERGALFDEVATLTTRGGERRTILLSTQPVEIGGQPMSLTTFTDITERRDAEERLERLNRTYAVLSDINQLMVREHEPESILTGACRIAVEKGGFALAWIGLAEGPQLRLGGYASTEGDGVELLAMLGAPSPRCQATARALATGTPVVCNDIAQDPMTVECRQVAMRHGFGALVSLPLVAQQHTHGVLNLYATSAGFFDADELRLLEELANDIGFALESSAREQDRQRALEALHTAQEAQRKNEERFRLLIESTSDLIGVINDAGMIRFLSPSVTIVFGYAAGSLEGRSLFELVHPDDVAALRRQLSDASVTAGRVVSVQIRIMDGDNEWRLVQCMARAVPGQAADGYIVFNAHDLTESRKLEEQLRQSQKMDAIGQLAGGVAHDFNNILAVVMMQAELTATTPELPEAVRDGLREIATAAEKAARLTRQLLQVSRRQVMQPIDLDLNAVVASLTKMLQRVLGEDIQLQLLLHPRPLITRVDASMLDQALMNLVINARDAMPGGGRLIVATDERVLTADEARLIADASPGTYVSVRVTDTGRGIAPDALPHIFEPFFTTKEPGKGTGLGLATVFGIVRQHGGTIRAESVVDRGTMFELLLPKSTASHLAPVLPQDVTPWVGGTEAILVVEDEPAVRLSTRAVLEMQGYHVLEAANGVEALRIWDEHPGAIDLLLTDMVMPAGISGRELAERLQQRQPGLRVVFSSGYSQETAGRDIDLLPGHLFLQKPYPPQSLLQAVRRILDTKRAG